MFLHDKFSSLNATWVNNFPRNVSLTAVLYTSPVVCGWSRVLLVNYCTKDVLRLCLPLIWETVRTTTSYYSCVTKDTEKILVQRKYVIVFYNAYTLFGYSLLGAGKFIFNLYSEPVSFGIWKYATLKSVYRVINFLVYFVLINEKRSLSEAQLVSSSWHISALHPFSDAYITYWTTKMYFGQTLYFDFQMLTRW